MLKASLGFSSLYSHAVFSLSLLFLEKCSLLYINLFRFWALLLSLLFSLPTFTAAEKKERGEKRKKGEKRTIVGGQTSRIQEQNNKQYEAFYDTSKDSSRMNKTAQNGTKKGNSSTFFGGKGRGEKCGCFFASV